LTESLSLDGKPLLAALEDAGIRFIVIGGFAVSAHGHLRAIKDLDIVPAPDQDNLSRLANLLRELGAEVLGMNEFAKSSATRSAFAGTTI
jgi:hypothetical protein